MSLAVQSRSVTLLPLRLVRFSGYLLDPAWFSAPVAIGVGMDVIFNSEPIEELFWGRLPSHHRLKLPAALAKSESAERLRFKR